MNDPRYQKIMAHQTHEVTPAETGEDRPINQAQKVDEFGNPYTLLWIGWQCIYVFKTYSKTHFGSMSDARDFDSAMRLLQAARALMEGV